MTSGSKFPCSTVTSKSLWTTRPPQDWQVFSKPIPFPGKLRLGSVTTKYKEKMDRCFTESSNAQEWLMVISSEEDVGRHCSPREFHQHMSYRAIPQAQTCSDMKLPKLSQQHSRPSMLVSPPLIFAHTCIDLASPRRNRKFGGEGRGEGRASTRDLMRHLGGVVDHVGQFSLITSRREISPGVHVHWQSLKTVGTGTTT